jgi:hypothetical protein
VEIAYRIPNARLAILPGTHGAVIGEMLTAMPGSRLPALTVAMIESFLNE